MATQDIQTALIKFAKSDLRIAKKDGIVVVTQSKIGNIEIEYDGDTFQASRFNTSNFNTTQLTGKMSFGNMATWLADKYQTA